MSYINSLSDNQKQNINNIIDEMNKSGLKNPLTQSAILSVISKESTFNPIAERGYSNTSNSRIRRIFGSRVSNLSEMELVALKSNPVAFFNRIYGGRYGNKSNEGFKFRGRGYNQLTFKGNYENVSNRIGIDLVKNPDKLENPKIASKASISYFTSAFAKGFSSSKKKAYKSDSINGFNDLNNAVLAVYHSNAGFGKPIYTLASRTSTGGLKKALDRAPYFLDYVNNYNSKKKV